MINCLQYLNLKKLKQSENLFEKLPHFLTFAAESWQSGRLRQS